MITRFCKARILRGHSFVTEDLWIADGKVIAPVAAADLTIEKEGCLIAPGYIDLQLNGGWGADFSSDPNAADSVAAKLPLWGVTAFLPTVVTSSLETYRKVLPRLQPRTTAGATILGIHLEGPFLNPLYCGAHDPELFRSLSGVNSLETVYGSLAGVKMMTLAPELLEALPWIERLTKLGIVVSAGHTDASDREIANATAAGLKMVTHLYNAMRPFYHRDPGVIGETLTNHQLHFSIIADGIHISPGAVHLAWNANPGGLILVSDAMAGAGLEEGRYTLGGKEAEVSSDRAFVAGTETLAGSIVGLDAAVRNLWRFTGCTREQAIEAASLKPAQLLGIADVKGSLYVGVDADFNILDSELNVLECYVNGISTSHQN